MTCIVALGFYTWMIANLNHPIIKYFGNSVCVYDFSELRFVIVIRRNIIQHFVEIQKEVILQEESHPGEGVSYLYFIDTLEFYVCTMDKGYIQKIGHGRKGGFFTFRREIMSSQYISSY